MSSLRFRGCPAAAGIAIVRLVTADSTPQSSTRTDVLGTAIASPCLRGLWLELPIARGLYAAVARRAGDAANFGRAADWCSLCDWRCWCRCCTAEPLAALGRAGLLRGRLPALSGCPVTGCTPAAATRRATWRPAYPARGMPGTAVSVRMAPLGTGLNSSCAVYTEEVGAVDARSPLLNCQSAALSTACTCCLC